VANNKCRTMPALSAEDVARFWSLVDRSGGPDACWPWIGTCFGVGYGRFGLGNDSYYANRIAMFLGSGIDPGSRMACHSCDIRYPVGSKEYRKCCNPEHLFAGTNQENTADRHAKGRSASGDRNGSRTHPERLMRGPRPQCGSIGEKNGSSKLTDPAIVAIRELRRNGLTQQAIADRFGVTQVLVGKILRGDLWKHVKEISERAA